MSLLRFNKSNGWTCSPPPDTGWTSRKLPQRGIGIYHSSTLLSPLPSSGTGTCPVSISSQSPLDESSADLIADNRFFSLFQIFYKIQYFNCKCNWKINEFVWRFFHEIFPFRWIMPHRQGIFANITLIFHFFHHTERKRSASYWNEMACRGVMKWRREMLHIVELWRLVAA